MDGTTTLVRRASTSPMADVVRDVRDIGRSSLNPSLGRCASERAAGLTLRG